MAFKLEDLQKRLAELLVDGTGLYIAKKLVEFSEPYLKKHTKQWHSPGVKIGLSLIDLFIPAIREVAYVGDWLELWGKRGIEELETIFMDKPEECWAEDENTIKCINFDTTAVTVKIDGASVSPTVSGTAEELTLSLPSPLSKGAHDLVVTGNRRAFRGKIYV